MADQRNLTHRTEFHPTGRKAFTSSCLTEPGEIGEGEPHFKLVLLPKAEAPAFRRFCRANSKACPLIGRVLPGTIVASSTDGSRDTRSNVASYDIYSFGAHLGTQPDVSGIWQDDDLVGFALGSTAALDPVLRAEGIGLREPLGRRSPCYVTRFRASAVGPFSADLVVSMRSVARRDVDRLYAVASRHPLAHGAPVHVGDPSLLGIADLARPDWGVPVEVGADEVPVFFASSLTARQAVATAHIALSIVSAPGHRLFVPRLAGQASAIVA